MTLCRDAIAPHEGHAVRWALLNHGVPVCAANPEALEWASGFRAAFGDYEEVYAELLALNAEGANRWRVSMLASEWALSDGCFAKHEMWEARADRIEERIRSGTY